MFSPRPRFLFHLLLLAIFLLFLVIWRNFLWNNPWQSARRIPILHSGQFCVLFNFTRPISIKSSFPITLAVHSTLHFAHKLHVQAQHWDGPISAAILIRPDEQFAALPNLFALWQCSQQMRQKVSLHLVWRIGPFQTDCGQISMDHIPTEFNCPMEIYPKKVVLPLAVSIQWPPLRYPINPLRNIARLGASPNSPFHVVADVENIFSANFTAIVWAYLAQTMAKKEGKELLVFRRFEVEKWQKMATNLAHLQQQIQRGLAFPFHRHHFPVGHRIPGLPEWMAYSLQNSTVRTSQLEFMNAAFEPQFVMPSNAPLHFEGVPARLFDHQVLVIELCRAGFRLRLLSHVFNVHQGVRRSLNNAERLIKWIGAKQIPKFRREFREYLGQKYGQQNAGNCPNFWDRLNLPAKKNSSTGKTATTIPIGQT